ncbi:capsid decoration protein [Mycobacterium phage LilSpotty]|uniref:Capsid decoration protein n=1 Tax=Mycobacterium phage LilSpotty TaxID=2588512 RepID=A0A4Y6ELZ6_9CAUD|nr:capsid decoration protein [Mycobacterium phage LilSpotty]QDF19738.1 capsid decoration protein [Mycobacterium phage LilSpotty]
MTQLGIRTESFGAGDQSWLLSRRGADAPASATLDPTAWTSKTSEGRIKSGEPFAIVSNLAVPYDSAGEGGTEVLAGFILTDQSVRSDGGNVTFPYVWEGRIKLSKLPSTVAADATTTGTFVLEA